MIDLYIYIERERDVCSSNNNDSNIRANNNNNSNSNHSRGIILTYSSNACLLLGIIVGNTFHVSWNNAVYTYCVTYTHNGFNIFFKDIHYV